jgi:hypothetical protein
MCILGLCYSFVSRLLGRDSEESSFEDLREGQRSFQLYFDVHVQVLHTQLVHDIGKLLFVPLVVPLSLEPSLLPRSP